MSLQNNMKSRGPRQLPWAVPYVIWQGSEYVTVFGLVVTLATKEQLLK